MITHTKKVFLTGQIHIFLNSVIYLVNENDLNKGGIFYQ